MRTVGTTSRGVRCPVVREGDDLVKIVTDAILACGEEQGLTFHDRDIVAVTEAVVARSQGNYAGVEDIAADCRAKFGADTVALTFPILSRNRIAICLKGIAKAFKKVYILMSYPSDEVGNHLFDEDLLDEKGVNPWSDVLDEAKYRELFGYEKGAFTGASSSGKIGKIELANHGTLFLDEIGELPAHIQSKLLQLIQEKTIERLSGTQKIELDFRLIVATNRNLEEAVQRGLFRSDLFYRLNVIRIHIPPLRQRKEDIVPMAHQFLARFCGEYNKSLTCSPRFLAFLEQYDWPGNVRQLENLMERLVITAQDPILDIPALPLEYTADASAPAELLPGGTLAERMDAYEAQIIRDSYQRCGTTVAVARELGLDDAKLNVNGGAIALGHPIGASGCRILVSLVHEMKKRNARKGIATLCIGGGQGVALAIER